MEIVVLVLFCLILMASILLHFSLVAALLAGLLIFVAFAVFRHFSAVEILQMILDGVKKASNILITFLLIGMMTALWRAAGTIPSIVSYSANLLLPQIMILISFLLCCLVSFLTGTSFGTGATMGVICASVGMAMKGSPIWLGGAILSGCYFGDRCSPVSTSMLLTASLTQTDSYGNIKRMFQSAAVPFAVTCCIYLVAGLVSVPDGEIPDMAAVFSREFQIHPVALFPAIIILVLAILHVPVKKAMMASIIASIPICILMQGRGGIELLHYMVTGFRADDEMVAPLVNGGGILSMVKCGAIVCISSAYAGIFEKTRLLEGIRQYIMKIAERTNGFTAILLTSVVTAMAACNQTLSTMLTYQLCEGLTENKEDFALQLEDTVVVIAPLIPWSIAGSTVLNSSGLPINGILVSVYLYLLPLWGLLCSYKKQQLLIQQDGPK